ncbi:hypothetical protein PVAG01_07537 [Phlyctema vagabunda]|uniref:Uncharacterized protein n=1 Tax=Phlyctema vagabunda TaxID=108571 RepID=A0ABR4PCQ2_9HELO
MASVPNSPTPGRYPAPDDVSASTSQQQSTGNDSDTDIGTVFDLYQATKDRRKAASPRAIDLQHQNDATGGSMEFYDPTAAELFQSALARLKAAEKDMKQARDTAERLNAKCLNPYTGEETTLGACIRAERVRCFTHPTFETFIEMLDMILDHYKNGTKSTDEITYKVMKPTIDEFKAYISTYGN